MSAPPASATSNMSATAMALAYLYGLPGTTFSKLYRQPSSALAIFRRMLPHLAKSIVMAMLYTAHPLPEADLDAWVRPDDNSSVLKDQAVSVLMRLHILRVVPEPRAPRAFSLSNKFARSLRQALAGGGGNHGSFGVPCSTPDPDAVDVGFLDDYARGQWEAILYYMVGSASGGVGLEQGGHIGEGTRRLLRLGEPKHYVEVRGGNRVVITKAGFEFLLQDANAQVWSMLIKYLDNAPSLKMDIVDVLTFLFMLGSLELGRDYSTATLTATQIQMLDDLADFGIVYRCDGNADRFYPTRIATTLTSDAGALLSSASRAATMGKGTSGGGGGGTNDKGYIIVETNYRLYAYTSSVLQIAVLNLFCRLSTRFPNLVSGKLTKESVQAAIGLGITAEQIVSYLTAHAHPQMSLAQHAAGGASGTVLPPTVADQIRLWQIEGERIKAREGYIVKDFASHAEWADVVKYTKDLGVWVWDKEVVDAASGRVRWLLFVTEVAQLQYYLTAKKEQMSAAAANNEAPRRA